MLRYIVCTVYTYSYIHAHAAVNLGGTRIGNLASEITLKLFVIEAEASTTILSDN